MIRYIFFTTILISSLFARSNPFQAPFELPSIITDSEKPLLNIQKNDSIHIASSVPTNRTTQIGTTTKVIKSVENKVSKIKTQPSKLKPHPTRLLPPIVISDDARSIICCDSLDRVKKSKKKRKKSFHKKRKKTHPTLLFKNYFLKVILDGSRIKIFTKDCLIKKSFLKNPQRSVLDFKRLQYMKTFSKKISSSSFRSLKVGSHHCFYRVSLTINKKVSLVKTKYGYIIK